MCWSERRICTYFPSRLNGAYDIHLRVSCDSNPTRPSGWLCRVPMIIDASSSLTSESISRWPVKKEKKTHSSGLQVNHLTRSHDKYSHKTAWQHIVCSVRSVTANLQIYYRHFLRLYQVIVRWIFTQGACIQGLEANIIRSWLIDFTLRVKGHMKEKQKQMLTAVDTIGNYSK